MRVAIATFDGFDELDAFVAFGLINQLREQGWSAEVAGPAAQLTSMHGLTVTAQRPLAWCNEADAVIFSHGLYQRAIAEDGALLAELRLDPLRQWIAGQNAGTLMLARLGLLGDAPACTDTATRPFLVEAGVVVLDEPFHARGPVATAGGRLAAQYLAAWLIAARAGLDCARQALRSAAPVAEQDAYADQVLAVVQPFLEPAAG